jgi:hypothetical protein
LKWPAEERYLAERSRNSFAEEEQEQGPDGQTSADENTSATGRQSPGLVRRRPSNFLQGGPALVAAFLLGCHPYAALGTKMILFLRMGEVIVTGRAIALAHPHGSVADRALHKAPPGQACQ